MAGNYQNNGNDWYQNRLNTIASMMSMQQADPEYLLGAAISQYFLKPQISKYLKDKFTGTGDSTGNIDANGNYYNPNDVSGTENTGMNAALNAYAPTTGFAAQNAQEQPTIGSMGNIGANNPEMQRQNNAQTKPNESMNADVNQAVMQTAQNEGAMQGAMNIAASDAQAGRYVDSLGSNPFQQAPSAFSNTGGANSGYSGLSPQQMLYREIINLKNDWSKAQANNDAQGMQEAEQRAKILRDIAAEEGISLSGSGAGNTAEEAQARLDRLVNDGAASEQDIKYGMLNQIAESKQKYADAQKANDAEGMKDAQLQADIVRQIAKENGIDVSEGDSDVSIDSLVNTIQKEQAKQAQQEHVKEQERLRNLTPQELLQNPEVNVSPNDFYQRAYFDMIDKRIPEYMARAWASDYANQYEANYMTNLQNALGESGLNPDGSINPIGVQLLSKAVTANNPQVAQLIANQYASPRDVWGFARDVDKANIQQDFNRENMDTRYKQSVDMLGRKTAAQKDVNAFNANLNLQTQDYLTKLRDQLSNRKGAQEAADRQELAQRMLNSGEWTENEAVFYAKTGKLPEKGSGSESGTDKTPQWAKNLNEQIAVARRTLDGDEIDKLKDKIAANASDMTQAQLDYYNSAVFALNAAREHGAGYDDTARSYYDNIPEDLRDELLPGYEFLNTR